MPDLRHLLALTAVVAAALTGCERHSAKVDPEDLQGVFDRPAASAGASARKAAPPPKKKKRRRKRREGEPALPPPRLRPAPRGPCLEVAGNAADLPAHNARRPACRGARVLERRDRNGNPRYACLFGPSDLASRGPVPLVLFFHGRYENPGAVRRKTRLRRRARKLVLSADGKTAGFGVLAVQSRRLKGRMVFDTGHRSRDNVDVRTTAAFIADMQGEGWVDRRQIYAIGDGDGATMAALYAHLHPEQVAAYGGFAADLRGFTWSCDTPPPPAGMIYRACDAVVPCADIDAWADARAVAEAPTFALRLGSAGRAEPACAYSRCRRKTGEANHRRWPKLRERDLLEYLGRFRLDVKP